MKSYLMVVASLLAIGSVTQAATTNVNVTANPLWTDSGVALSAGDSVTITPLAGDTWRTWTGMDDAGMGPSGSNYDNSYNALNDKFTTAALHSAMIAYIGNDPLQGHALGDTSFWPQATGYIAVNNGISFTAASSGKLWLGCNDDARTGDVQDNSGFIRTTVSVNAVPVPGAILLGMVGTGLVGAIRRRRVA